MPLEAQTVAVCAKASEGTGYADPFYAHYKAEAARVGAVFFGYHFLHAGNGAAQAAWCFKQTGPGVNVMVDCEPTGASDPSVQDCVDFAHAYRALGGLCTLDYLPKWYWQQLGSPSLAPLRAAGLELIASDYASYSDTGPGWAAYGGSTPAVWQYTDAQAYSGQSVDFNAYRGTINQFKALLGYIQGGDMPLTAADAQLVANTLLDTEVPRAGHNSSGQPLTGTESLRSMIAWSQAGIQGTRDGVAAVSAAVAKLSAPVSPVVDATALAAALVGNAAFVAAIAHAVGVELHHDTPAV
jgi:hypothetical protein